MARKQWIRLDGEPGLELISQLPFMGAYYRGARLVMCDSTQQADTIISELRAAGTGCVRCDAPAQSRWSDAQVFVVSTGVHKPSRGSIW